MLLYITEIIQATFTNPMFSKVPTVLSEMPSTRLLKVPMVFSEVTNPRSLELPTVFSEMPKVMYEGMKVYTV